MEKMGVVILFLVAVIASSLIAAGPEEPFKGTSVLSCEEALRFFDEPGFCHSCPTLAAIEETALAVFNTPEIRPELGVKFYETLDNEIRSRPELVADLLTVTLRRLPQLEGQEFNIVLSGAVADSWAALLKTEAARRGLNINLVILPGGLSRHATNPVNLSEIPAEKTEVLKGRPSIFIDDTFSTGGTAKQIRELVESRGGKFEGTAVVYDGGKGDAISLYKSGRWSWHPPSMGNLPPRPERWEWVSEPSRIAIELNGTLYREGSENLTLQGQTLMKELESLGSKVQLLKSGAPVAADDSIKKAFPGLTFLGPQENVDIALGNWGNNFMGVPKGQRPSIGNPSLETLRIGETGKNGVYTEAALPRDYFLDVLVQNGFLAPVTKDRPAVPLTPRPARLIDLRK